ncbi:MAG: SET domain-containing protein-lysine N-methyltransferase, partial [Candidatus Tectomicrobia bacterium]|nr:SET domain-containing protein-lysine N-methyltransferase [Candidatus Tectomicrobia bacterium]
GGEVSPAQTAHGHGTTAAVPPGPRRGGVGPPGTSAHVPMKAAMSEVEPSLGPPQITIAEGFFIGPLAKTEREGGMIFSIHSCDPDLGIQGQIVFVALRNIQPGEELTHGWATTDDASYEMQCHCGAQHCRGIITGQDWRRKEL